MSLYVNIPATAGNGANSAWFGSEAAAHIAAVPQLTESAMIQAGISNVAETQAASLLDAGREGGAVAANAAWVRLTQDAIWQNVKTSKWAVSIQASLAPLVTAKASYVGVVNSGGTNYVAIRTGFDTNATQFVTLANNGSDTVTGNLGTADTSTWTWRIYSDGTTVTFNKCPLAGGAPIVSATLATAAANFPTSAMMPGVFSSSGNAGQAVFKMVYSYVGPT